MGAALTLCKPIGICRRLFANPIFNAMMNLLLNILTCATLIYNATLGMEAVSECGAEFRGADKYSGQFYVFWMALGAWLAGILAAINGVITVIEALEDFELINMDDCIWDERMDSVSTWFLWIKGGYMKVNCALEPMMLIYIQASVTVDAEDNWTSVISAAATALAHTSFNYTNSTNALGVTVDTGAAGDRVRAVRECTDDRYKTLASTGIGALLASWQTNIRLYLKVGKMLREMLNDNANYRQAYEVAKRHFGGIGAILVLVGFSDENEDVKRALRVVVPPDVEELAEDLGVLSDDDGQASWQLQMARNMYTDPRNFQVQMSGTEMPQSGPYMG